MKKAREANLFISLFLLAICSVKGQAQSSQDYIVNAGSEQLTFVRQPELGYVAQSQQTTDAIESLDGTLRQFGAKDIRPVRGAGRRGILVVYSRQTRIENENTMAGLRAQGRIKYVAPLFSSNGETIAIIPEIVVRVTAETQAEQLRMFCQTMNLAIRKRLDFTDSEYLIETPATDADGVFAAVEQLSKADFVEWAVPNIAFRPRLLGQVIPNDTYFANQWHLNNTGQSGGTPDADIDAPEAWLITTGDPNIIVAVLDEGVDTSHPDLINNITAGYDFYDDDSTPDPSGDDAHGTACAGLVAAQGNNGTGVTGVAWRCKIMPIRISGNDGDFITDADIATAFRWAANHGADVLSNSWGSVLELPVIYSAIVDVTEQGGIGREGKGCVVLAASGNWASGGSVIYPAKYSEVIAVGATNHNDVVWYYSGGGAELDIVAPSGECNLLGNIWTTDIAGSSGYNNRNPGITDYTDRMGGTSAACPIAAGAAALVLSLDPDLTNIDVQEILQDSAVDLGSPGFDNSYGHGRVDARSALDMVLMSPEQQWAARYNGPGNGTDSARALAVDSSGNVYVTGQSRGIGTNDDYATIKYGSGGNELWVKRYNGPGNSADSAKALAVDSSGNVYITGQSRGSGTSDDYATIKYDTSGNELWVKRYYGPANNSDYATTLAVDGGGNIYVTGYSYGSGTSGDYATIKYGADSNELWVRRYNGPGNDYDSAGALAVDGLGNVYVAGTSIGSGTSYDYATIKYSAGGNELWVKRYNGPGNNYDSANALAVDDSGNVYVAGESYGSSTSYDYATIKYDTDGNELWMKRYNGPGNSTDSAYALAVDGSGNVYTAGASYGTNNDYATIKYGPRNNCTEAIDGDLNSDCKVDFEDFAILANDWLEGSDWSDLTKICSNWLECNLVYQGDCW